MINLHHASIKPTSLWAPMNKATAAILALVGIVAFQASCGTARQRKCEEQLKERIRPGTPLEIADRTELSIASMRELPADAQRSGPGLNSVVLRIEFEEIQLCLTYRDQRHIRLAICRR